VSRRGWPRGRPKDPKGGPERDLEEDAPGQDAPGQDAPGQAGPGPVGLGHDGPGQDTPGGDMPGGEASGRAASGQAASGQAAPGRESAQDGEEPAGMPQEGDGAGSAPKSPDGLPTAVTAAEYLDQLQRLQAEFDNYRKRVRREQEDWQRAAQAELVSRLLPVLDDLRRAREHGAGDEAPDAAGLLLILKRFEDLLSKAGLEVQATEPGATFDPEEHEALLAVPSTEIEEGGIVQVLEPGYRFRDRLLRRSKVSCSTGPPQE